MSKEKQMVNDLIEIFDEEYSKRHLLTPQNTAEKLMQKGYRKASDVAEEIFAEIEAEIDAALTSNYNFIQQHESLDALWSRVNGKIDALRGIDGFLAELKKKHTEGTIDAVAVVRCKDCKCYEKGSNDSEGWEYCERTGVNCNADDYCSHGERREQ